MSSYTMSDVKEADRLWDKMPTKQVAEKLGASPSTIWRWSSEGLISTDTNHNRKVDTQKIERAEALCDHMSLRSVADMIGVHVSTLYDWKAKGLISPDKDWQAISGGVDKKANPWRVVEMYYEEDMSQREVAEKVGIARRTVRRYLRQYRNGNL